jgi:hypothetical protein
MNLLSLILLLFLTCFDLLLYNFNNRLVCLQLFLLLLFELLCHLHKLLIYGRKVNSSGICGGTLVNFCRTLAKYTLIWFIASFYGIFMILDQD